MATVSAHQASWYSRAMPRFRPARPEHRASTTHTTALKTMAPACTVRAKCSPVAAQLAARMPDRNEAQVPSWIITPSLVAR